MANVFFKRGLLANLNAQPKVDGTIYVTTDERAMYVDIDSETRIRIGDFREYANWASIEALTGAQRDPQALYYANSENILAKWDATRSRWVQVNGTQGINTLISYVHQFAANSDNNVVLTTQIADTGNNRVVGQTTYVSGNNTLLKVTGASTTDDTTGSSTYGRTTATVTLTPANIVDSSTLATSTTSSGTSAGAAITLTNKRIGTDAAGNTVNTSTDDTPIKLIAKGGLTIERNATNGDIEFRASSGISSVTTSFNSDGELLVRLFDLDNIEPTYTSRVTPTVQYGDSDETLANARFNSSGILTLDVYTTTQVDNLISNELKAIDAMTFKGTLGSAATIAALPTTEVSNGDVYKVVTAGQYNGQECRVGDMFIASGTEGIDGTISDTVTWNYIPSGNDETNNYSFVYDSEAGTIKFSDARGILSTITPGTNISVSGTSNIFSINHAEVTRTNTTGTAITQSTGSSATFNAITAIDSDATGHITGVTTTPITVVDTHNAITQIAYTKAAATENGVTTVTNTLNITEVDGIHTGTNTISSSSLNLSVSGTDTAIDMVWGTF